MGSVVDSINKEIVALASRFAVSIGAPVFLEFPSDDGASYVKVDGGRFHIISEERGVELGRESFDALDDVVYEGLRRVAKRDALNYELKNRVRGQDSRRIYFDKYVENMKLARDDFGGRALLEVEGILRNSPFSP